MLLPNPTIQATIFWQWLNQSHNAFFNYANRNASNVSDTDLWAISRVAVSDQITANYWEPPWTLVDGISCLYFYHYRDGTHFNWSVRSDNSNIMVKWSLWSLISINGHIVSGTNDDVINIWPVVSGDVIIVLVYMIGHRTKNVLKCIFLIWSCVFMFFS